MIVDPNDDRTDTPHAPHLPWNGRWDLEWLNQNPELRAELLATLWANAHQKANRDTPPVPENRRFVREANLIIHTGWRLALALEHYETPMPTFRLRKFLNRGFHTIAMANVRLMEEAYNLVQYRVMTRRDGTFQVQEKHGPLFALNHTGFGWFNVVVHTLLGLDMRGNPIFNDGDGHFLHIMRHNGQPIPRMR